MSHDQPCQSSARADQAIARLKQELQRTLNQGEEMVASSATHIHRAIDQLRAAPSHQAALRKVEEMSCMLMQFQNSRRAGLCNASASKLLRLRTTACRL